MISHMGIGDIADWLHPLSSEYKALALVQAYFDESGTHTDSTVTVIAGFVAGKEAWSSLEQQWMSFLDLYKERGVRFFHMSEMLRQNGQYSHVDTPGINFLITQASKAINENHLMPIYSGVVTEDWNAVVDDQEFLRRFPKPIDLCFDDIVRQLWEWAVRRRLKEKVSPMFAHSEEYSDGMGKVGRLYSKEQWYRRILGPIAFGHMEEVVPLQTADFIANQMRHHIEQREYSKSIWDAMRQTWALYNATPRGKTGHYFTADSLKRTVEQYRKTGEIYSLDAFAG